MIRRWEEAEHKLGTLEGIARLLDLASKLGRLASGMPTDKTGVHAELDVKLDLEWQVALQKAYGPIVDAEVVTESPPAGGTSVSDGAGAGRFWVPASGGGTPT